MHDAKRSFQSQISSVIYQMFLGPVQANTLMALDKDMAGVLYMKNENPSILVSCQKHHSLPFSIHIGSILSTCMAMDAYISDKRSYNIFPILDSSHNFQLFLFLPPDVMHNKAL